MQAYEFYATPQNGVLFIPEQYKNKIISKVKVILLEQNPEPFNGREANVRPPFQFGCLKGVLDIDDDFNDVLVDFKEYM